MRLVTYKISMIILTSISRSDYLLSTKKQRTQNCRILFTLLYLRQTLLSRTLHNIIGNFFKPSAVLAALGGPDSIRKFVYGGQSS